MLKQYCPPVEALEMNKLEHQNNAVHIKSFIILTLQ